MKSILAHTTVIAMACAFPAILCAELVVSLPKESSLTEETSRSLLRGNGKTEHQIEISKNYLDYAVNPVAMKRFLSLEQALMRKFDFPIISSPADQNFTEHEIYRARIDGSSGDGSHRVTILMLGTKKEFVAVRVHTTEGSAVDHDLVVSQIQIGATKKQEAQQAAP